MKRPSLKRRNTHADPTGDKQDHADSLPVWKDSQWWQVFVAAVLVPFGVYAVVIYSRQLEQMESTTKAATEGLALTREMNRLDQRAWVATSGASGELKVGEQFVAHVTFKNTGKTFARNAQFRIKTEITKKDALPNFDSLFDASKDGKDPLMMILAPNAQYESMTDPLENSPFSQEQIDNIRDNQELFVFGRVDYADVFDRGHWTTFCYRYNVKSGEYLYCRTHNDADNRSGD